MNDPFTTRVRAAAVAGWWTVLISIGFVLLLWGGYQVIISNKPFWLPRLWGPDVTWAEIQHLALWVIIAIRFTVWLLILVVLWLTLWARQLKKRVTQTESQLMTH